MAVTTLLDKVFRGDVGTVFRGTFKEDGTAFSISGATTKDIIFEKPDGTTVTKAGSFFTDGSDGVLQYASIANDLNIGGKWRLQGYIVTPQGSWHSDVVNFKVYDNLT